MRAKAAIVIWDEGQARRQWRRFVAVLCLMLFYFWFVHSGEDVWAYARALPGFRSAANESESWCVRFYGGLLGDHLMKVLASVVLYLCGRSLWYGDRLVRWWVRIAIVAFPAAIVVSFVCLRYSGAGVGTPLVRICPRLPDWCKWVGEFTFPLPWLVILLAAGWVLRSVAKGGGGRRRYWTLFAGIWCLGHAVATLTSGESILNWELLYALEVRGLSGRWLLLVVLLPLLVAMFLWIRRFAPARLLALILAVAAVTANLAVAHRMALYGYDIDALFYAYNVPVSHRAAIFPFGLLWANDSTFHWALVQPVMEAGPWFLIAWYAWRVPVWVPPEDGSPYPRRYCGKCHYNLHGIESARCPECGVELVPTVDDE